MYSKMLEHRNSINAECISLRKHLASLPPGKLICTKDKGYFKWYVRENGKLIYLKKKYRKQAEVLAEKRYLEEKLLRLEHELYATNLYLHHSQNTPPRELEFLKPQNGYSDLISCKYSSNFTNLSDWAKETYTQSTKYPETKTLISISNNVVRSKSELLIDSTLFSYNIPFRYECELVLNGILFYPDFTIKRPSDGKIIYWEHFGKMDDPNYAAAFLRKMSVYIENGIIPGDNLIMTFETENNVLDNSKIERVIKEYLI